MSRIRISVNSRGTSIEVEEESHPLDDSSVQQLGIAVRRVVDAMGGDRLNNLSSVALAMGVHVEWVE